MIIEHENLSFNTDSCGFSMKVDEFLLAKYLKGIYRSNKPRFQERFVKYFKESFKAYNLDEFNSVIDNIEYIWDFVDPFSYKEAFEIDIQDFKAAVFSSIDIREMIENLGAERVNVEGQELINKIWNPHKQEFENTQYSVVYELYHVNGEKLGLTENSKLPVVKCWCTTTNEEHWLWVNDGAFSNNSPLQAIASTCVIYKSMYGKIDHIIRQGDVFIFEMSEDVLPSEKEELMSLPMEDYFSLLKSQA